MIEFVVVGELLPGIFDPANFVADCHDETDTCLAGHWNCDSGTCRAGNGYWAPVKWSDAMKHCATYGKTLCGSSDAARCQNTGCYYNSIYQWTNEPCEPGDEGYECTTP